MALELDYIPEIGDRFRWLNYGRGRNTDEEFVILALKFGGSEILMMTEYDLDGEPAAPKINFPWQWSLNNNSQKCFDFCPKSRSGDGLW